MTDIWLWIVEKWPVLGIIIAAIIITWILAAKFVLPWKQKIERAGKAADGIDGLGAKIDKLSERISVLPCSAHDESISKHKDTLSEIGHKLDRLSEGVSGLPCSAHTESISQHKDMLLGIGHKLDGLSESISALPCSDHTASISKNKETLSEIERKLERLDSMGDQLSAVSRWIMKLDPKSIDSLAPKFSPRRMTKAGLSLFEMSGARKALDDGADVFLEQLHERNPQTPLDVEDEAYNVIMQNLSSPVFNEVKNFIYYQPEKITLKNDAGEDIEVSISLLVLIRLMSIDLRDRYLSAHPEIEEKNEDRHK